MPRSACRSSPPVAALLLLLLMAPGAGRALSVPLRLGSLLVGAIDTQGPLLAPAIPDAGGVSFWASWSLEPGSGVDPVDLRWLQRVTFSKALPGFPSPNRGFIDPRMGQELGDVTGDALPWYDITGSSKDALSLTGGGDDPWMGDGPYAPFSLAPLSFSAQTLVVAIDAKAKTAVILGGAEWGYAITDDAGGRTIPTPVVGLAASDGLRAEFNAALAADFPEWRLVAVPEPGTAALLAVGLAVAARMRRRARAAKRAAPCSCRALRS